MTETQANVIKMHIDYTTDVLKATNDVLEARANLRKAEASGNVHDEINALAKLFTAERSLKYLVGADEAMPVDDVEPLPDCGETKDEHADYYNRPRRMTADERADDPRRGGV
jgi:hypothetical protein